MATTIPTGLNPSTQAVAQQTNMETPTSTLRAIATEIAIRTPNTTVTAAMATVLAIQSHTSTPTPTFVPRATATPTATPSPATDATDTVAKATAQAFLSHTPTPTLTGTPAIDATATVAFATAQAFLSRTPTATVTLTPTPNATATVAFRLANLVATAESRGTGVTGIWINPFDEAIYILIPSGEFAMGTDNGTLDEQPAHTVYIDDFWVMQTEVSNVQFARCVETGRCSPPENNIWNAEEFAQYPVTNVNWLQATDYAEYVGGRLPTEAEWEKACRGIDARIYPWGNQNPQAQLLNYSGSLLGAIVPIGAYPDGASPYGLLDMVGNVSELIADWYGASYYSQSLSQNPQGPPNGSHRVMRGGSYTHNPVTTRCTYRFQVSQDNQFKSLGFRVVRHQATVVSPSTPDIQQSASIGTPTPIPTPKISIPVGFITVRDDVRSYSLAVPPDWVELDLRGQQFENMAESFGMSDLRVKLNEFLSSSQGETIGVVYISDLMSAMFGGLPTWLYVSVHDAKGMTQELAMEQLRLSTPYLTMYPTVINGIPSVRGSTVTELASTEVEVEWEEGQVYVEKVGLIADDKFYMMTLMTSSTNQRANESVFAEIIGSFRPE